MLWYTHRSSHRCEWERKCEKLTGKLSPKMWKNQAKSQPKISFNKRLMNYQTLTGLTALVATFAISTAASATPSVNSSQPNISVPSQQLIAQSVGIASFYSGAPHEGGSITANGERFNPNSSTAAHRTLPFGTRVRVTSVRTGKSVVVRINNRGPFIGGRIIDLSVGAARAIGLTSTGIGSVRMDVLGGGEGGGRRHGRRNRN